jgi:hypothetical protein
MKLLKAFFDLLVSDDVKFEEAEESKFWKSKTYLGILIFLLAISTFPIFMLINF